MNIPRSDNGPVLRWEKLGRERVFSVPELQERQARNPYDEDREQYRVWYAGEEAAFVTYDIFWPDQLNLYEMIVARHLRGRGIGTRILLFSRELAGRMGKPKLSVRAGQFAEKTKEELRGFYLRRGLRFEEHDPNLFLFDIDSLPVAGKPIGGVT